MFNKKKKNEVFVLLHDIRSVHNVGSMWRTANAGGVDKIFLSGYTPLPVDRFGRERKDFAKVALNSQKSVVWEYAKNPISFIKHLKKEGFFVVAIEQAKNSVDYKKVKIKKPVLLLVGNEVDGVSQKLLNLAPTPTNETTIIETFGILKSYENKEEVLERTKSSNCIVDY